MPSIQGAAHVGLTVRDMESNAQWYQRVFGWVPVRRYAEGGAGTPRIIMYDPESDFALGLCQPDDGTGDVFDYRRTALDHIGLTMADEAELNRWMAHLDSLGVSHSPIRDTGIGRFVTFDDPDGIQMELWLSTS